MSLLPAMYEDDDYIEELLDNELETPIEYGIDFETGQLTGELVEGNEAIKVWIYLALRTVRYKYSIYSWDYGSELLDILNNGFSREHITSEIKRMIKECLEVNKYIDNVTVSSVEFKNSCVKAYIQVQTILGDEFSEEYEMEAA